MYEICREIRPGDLTLRDSKTKNFLIESFSLKINMSPKGRTILKGNFIFPTITFLGICYVSAGAMRVQWVRC